MKPKHLSELIERIVREFDGLEVTYWIGGQTGVNEPLNIDEESEKVIKEFLRKALTLVSQETMKAVRVEKRNRKDESECVRDDKHTWVGSKAWEGHCFKCGANRFGIKRFNDGCDFTRTEQRWREKEWGK